MAHLLRSVFSRSLITTLAFAAPCATSANGGEAIDGPHGNPYAVKSYEKLGMHVIIDWVPNHTA